MVKLFFCTIMQFSVHIDYLTKDLKEIEPLIYSLTFVKVSRIVIFQDS